MNYEAGLLDVRSVIRHLDSLIRQEEEGLTSRCIEEGDWSQEKISKVRSALMLPLHAEFYQRGNVEIYEGSVIPAMPIFGFSESPLARIFYRKARIPIDEEMTDNYSSIKLRTYGDIQTNEGIVLPPFSILVERTTSGWKDQEPKRVNKVYGQGDVDLEKVIPTEAFLRDTDRAA